MIAIVRSELRKVVSTKVWWILLFVLMGYVGLTQALLVWTVAHSAALETGTGQAMPMPTGADAARMIYATGASFGYVFPAIIGALIVTNEYRYLTITPTFLAEPHRGRVLAGKCVAALPFAALTGVAITVTSLIFGAGVLALLGKPTALNEAATWEFFARCTVAMTLWGLVGVGLGALVKNQVAAIVGLLGFTQFLEPILRMLPMFNGNNYPVLNYLPGAVGDAVSGMSLYSFMSQSPADPLAFGWAVLVLAGYAALFCVVGYFATLRRDVS